MLNSRDQKILKTLEEYYGADSYPEIAVEYPYGSRLDSLFCGEDEEGVIYYADWGEVIQCGMNDDHDSREFVQLAEGQPDWGNCGECQCRISDIGANPISAICRGEEQWFHFCSAECLLKFAGRRDPETLRKEVAFMAKRVANLQKFIETEISPE